MDEELLVKKVLAGDQKAFGLLISQYKKLVFQIVARLIDNDQDREELCQDVFVKVFEKMDKFKFESKLSTWIATIAYRMAINVLKKKKTSRTEEDLDVIAFKIGNEDLSIEQGDFTNFVHSLIKQMPENYRVALTLFHIEGFSYPEIVAVMDVPENTVKSYLFRAREKLRTLVQPYIGTEI
uniref:RNA polymerase sigma factor n=1 Tax=Fulvivirga sp. TaxID=1931237 RepID=UPI004049460D